MQLTKDYLLERFNVFNEKYFENLLTVPKFEISRKKTKIGMCYYSGAKKYTIEVSDYYVLPEKVICNVLLHEMIHLFIRQNNIKDNRTHHGNVFYSYAQTINEDGWDISRCTSVKGYPVNEENTFYHLFAFEDARGRYFVMKYHPNKYDYFMRYFLRHQNYYTNLFSFTSTDSKEYGSMPKCNRSVRGRFISKNEFTELEKNYKEKAVC